MTTYLLENGLVKIDQNQLRGKYMVWCYQFILYRRVMWPLKMSNIPLTTGWKSQRTHQKVFGTETDLYGRNIFQLLLQSMSLGYMQEKTRLVFEWRESTDQMVRNAKIKISHN